jgi:hypothetical protein
MSSAAEYMVGNAPQGVPYAPPLVGQQIGQAIGDLPKDYYEGQQRQRQLAVMNAFPEGIPTNPDGTPNVNEVVGRLARAGGGNYVQQLLPFMMQQQGAQAIGRGLSGVDNYINGAPPPGAQTGPRASTTSGPANLAAAPAAPAAPQAPAAPGQGQSVLQILAARGLPATAAGPIAKDLGVLPTDPVNTNDPAVRSKLGMALQQLTRSQQAQQAAPAQVAAATPAPPAPAPGQQLAQAGAPGGQQPASPAVATPASEVPTPDATKTGTLKSGPPFAPNQSPSANRDLQQVGEDSDYPLADREANIATMKRIDAAIGLLSQQGVYASASGNTAAEAAIKQRIDGLQQRRQQIFDYLSKGEQAQHEFELGEQKSPDALKIAKQAGYPDVESYERAKKQHELVDVGRDKDVQAYKKMAGQADEARPQIAFAKRLVDAPGFIAGSGKPFLDTLSNLGASLGLGTGASVNQIFDKIRSGGILDQIKSMAGTGPVRVAEMKFIDQMMAGRENQPESLRAILTVNDRLYERAQVIRGFIQANHGVIDDKVEGQIQKYVNEHSLFRPEEMKDPRSLGAPTFNTPADVHAGVAQGIIRRHEPFWTADNPPRVKYVP